MSLGERFIWNLIVLIVFAVGGFLTRPLWLPLIEVEPKGVDILLAEKTAKAGALTLTVHHVWLSALSTRVEMSAANGGGVSLSLPVGFSQLNAPGGATLTSDPLLSSWPDAVPPHELVRGTVHFGQLPAGTTKISVGFNQVFGPGPKAITIRDIALRSSAPCSLLSLDC